MLYNLNRCIYLIFVLGLCVLGILNFDLLHPVLVSVCAIAATAWLCIYFFKTQAEKLHSAVIYAQKIGLSHLPQHGHSVLAHIVEDINHLMSRLVSAKKVLSVTLDSIQDAVFRIDTKGHIRYANNTAEKLINRQLADLVDKNYFDLMNDLIIDCGDCEEYAASVPRHINQKTKFKIKSRNQSTTLEQNCSSLEDEDKVLTGFVIVLRDITRAEKLKSRLKYQANYDPVTRLYNRYKFEQRLTDIWHSAKVNDEQHALIQLDMDRFKLINDNAGHAAGDQLLREIGTLLKNNVRQSDVCARTGGDEFAVLLVGINDDALAKVLAKINSAIKAYQFNYAGKIFPTGASIGATIINKHSPEIVDVKREADAACFMAKNLGPNNVKLFDRFDLHLSEHQEAPKWAARINQAIDNNQFELFYQPIIKISDSKQTQEHFEILLRLKEGDKLLNPGVFLPAVERFRLSARVDEWVVRNTFVWLEQRPHLWHKAKIAINLSADSLTNEHLISQILEIKGRSQFPSTCICFEITESAAVANMAIANTLIGMLRKAGFEIALDDFGKGFSTYSYMKNLSAEYIKIDGSFVQGMATDNRDLAIVRSIHQVSSSMGMKTIAEFVEDTATYQLLCDLGVDFVQGYAISCPMPLSQYDSAGELSVQVG